MTATIFGCCLLYIGYVSEESKDSANSGLCQMALYRLSSSMTVILPSKACS